MKENSIQPPELFLRLFRWFAHPDLKEDIEGDLLELFQRRVDENGLKKARFFFVCDVLKLFRPGIIRPFKSTRKFNNSGMLKNYIITAFRNMRREKLFTFMNIAGLALGMGCALAIYQIISHELNFDRHHTHFADTYRIINEYHDPVQGTVYFPGQIHPMGEALRNDFSGVVAAMTYYAKEGQVSIINKGGDVDKYQETSGLVYAEPGIFKIFDFDFIAGDPNTALSQPGSVVLTNSLVQKYFKVKPEEVSSAIGKTILVEGKATLAVTAVIADPPQTTDLPFYIIGSYQDQTASNPYFRKGIDWNEYNDGTNCFVVLSNGVSPGEFEEKLIAFEQKYKGKESTERIRMKLQPLAELHTSSQVSNYSKRQVTMPMIYTLGTIGFFLIITACINFVNLSTAQATKRAREIGIRKTLGSSRGQLVLQHVGETLLTSFMSVGAGLIIAEFLFNYLEAIIGYKPSLLQSGNLQTLLFLFSMVVGIGLLSGFYPALVLAKMNLVVALKNTGSGGVSGFLSVRRVLVIGQFAISQILIIGTIVIHLQMSYFLSKDPGFNKEAILIMKLPLKADSIKLATLKNSLLLRSDIAAVSFQTRGPMATWAVQNPINYPGLTLNDHSANLKTADENYLELYQLKLIAGRNYGPEKNSNSAVVNRKLTMTLGFKDPAQAVGETFRYGGDSEFKIVGVVEDFNAYSLDQGLDNVVLANLPYNVKELAVKFQSGQGDYTHLQQNLRAIESEWNKNFPDRVFDFRFYDDEIQKMYQSKAMISKVSALFALVAIFIGSLGLYALVSWLTNQKTKEIGIRKVLGASMWDVQLIFSREMLALILTAFAIAGPAGYYVMNSWLNDFANKIQLTPVIFIASVGVSILIAAVTISYKTLAAARINPVKALKSE